MRCETYQEIGVDLSDSQGAVRASGPAHGGTGMWVPYKTSSPQALMKKLCAMRLPLTGCGVCYFTVMERPNRRHLCRERRLGAPTRQRALRS